MPAFDVLDMGKKKVGTVNLSDEVFGAKVNVGLVHQVIKAQLAGRRRGTAKTKTKSEVNGSGKKPFRQKGTGNARQGTNQSPLQVGGGQSHGPLPRSYEQSTPKEMMAGALRSALSDRAKAKRLLVVDNFKFEAPKTKKFAEVVKSLGVEKALFVDEKNENFERSGRNLHGAKVLRTEGLNTYDIVGHEWLVLSKASAEALDKRLGGKKAAKKD